MSATPTPRPMVLAGALLAGVLLALAVTMVGQRFGLNLGALWSDTGPQTVPVGAALAWWMTASGAFAGGYVAASLLSSAAELPSMVRYALIGFGFLVLAAAGQAASTPAKVTSASIVIAGIAALLLGAAMSFCGAQLALRKD